MHYGGDGINCL